METGGNTPNNSIDGAVELAPLSLLGNLAKLVFVVVTVMPRLDVIWVKCSRSNCSFGLTSNFTCDEIPFAFVVKVDEAEKLVEGTKFIDQ